MNKPMCQSRDIGLDGLYFGKWGKNPLSKSPAMTLTLIRQCSMSNLSIYFNILQYNKI